MTRFALRSGWVLGMAALTIGLPGLPRLPGRPDRPIPAVASGAPSGASATGAAATGAAASGAAAASSGGTSTVVGGSGPAGSAKRRLSPLIAVAHGAFAVTTMLLVLLAALGVGAG